MLSELTTGMVFFICASIAAASWLGGAYSIYRGLQCLPDGQHDVPFFSADPTLISHESMKWRRRIYACMGYFALSLAITLVLRHGH